MKYDAFATEGRRLVLLQALHASAQYRANDALLRRYCQGVGHTVSADRLAADLAWLREQDLIVLREQDGVKVATLTQRGRDVADGSAEVPGVQRPDPGT